MNYPKTDHRDTWEEDESGIVNELEDDQVKKIATVLMDEIKALPIERETFGLMHGDIHPGNFHYDGKELTIFDFDDAAYNYFIHDLAMVLYYSVLFTTWTAERRQTLLVNSYKCYGKAMSMSTDWRIAGMNHYHYFTFA